MKLITETLHQAETRELGARFGRRLKPGDVVCLIGDLGTGKTTFIKGVAEALGIAAREITSASFIIIAEHYGTWPLYHIDLYRLTGSRDLQELGIEEYLEGDGIAVVEWADRLRDRNCTFSVEIQYGAGDGRQITISGSTERMNELNEVPGSLRVP